MCSPWFCVWNFVGLTQCEIKDDLKNFKVIPASLIN